MTPKSNFTDCELLGGLLWHFVPGQAANPNPAIDPEN